MDELRYLKSLPTAELAAQLDKLLSKISLPSACIEPLKEVFDALRIPFPSDQHTLELSIALSVVLADIGSQPSSWLRHSNIDKIKEICQVKGLDFASILALTTEETAICSSLADSSQPCGNGCQKQRTDQEKGK